MYLNNINTLDVAKSEFRKLSILLHPDTSGYSSESDFIQMYNEFKALAETLKFNTGFESDKNFNADKFYNNIKKFEALENIKISFVGSFIWLEDIKPGAMYEQKEMIKDVKINGYNSARWARKKKNWYFSPEDYKQKSKSKKSLSELKNSYGCKSFKTKMNLQLN